MGKGGHNIKPVSEHRAKGNVRPSRHAGRLEQAAKVVDTPPDPPKHYDQRHKNLWNICCKEVFEMGVLAPADIHLLEVFVCNFILWQDAVKELQEKGYMVTIEAGDFIKEIPNPAIRIMNDSSKLVNQIADKFGFSPRARMGIKTQDAPPADPLAAFLN